MEKENKLMTDKEFYTKLYVELERIQLEGYLKNYNGKKRKGIQFN